MKALPVQELPTGDWLYEIKFDGYRALAFKDGKNVRLVSRNKNAFDYPPLLEALKKLPAEHVILDGEIAALDEKGRSSFQLLQLFKSSEGIPMVYYVFDLLFLEGKDLRKEPLSARRKLLARVLKNRPEKIRLSDELRGTKDELLRVARRVWPRGPSRQETEFGLRKRSAQRCLGQIQDHQGSGIRYRRLHVARRRAEIFGSLLVGCQSPEGLVYAGRVGTGFSDKVLANLYAKFQNLKTASCPFVNLPEKSKGRWGLGITPAVMKRCQWLKPVLIAQVKFTEWTHDDQLRQPVFLGLRSDKQAKDVVRKEDKMP